MKTWGGRQAQRLTRLCLETYGTRCHLCGRMGATTADHIVPRSAGGSDDLMNLRPAHASCNYSRQDMPIAVWRKKHSTSPAQAVSPRWS